MSYPAVMQQVNNCLPPQVKVGTVLAHPTYTEQPAVTVTLHNWIFQES